MVKDLLSLLFSTLVPFAVKWFVESVAPRIVSFRRAQRSVANCPGSGELLWLDPFYSLALVLAPFFPRAGSIGHYSGKFYLYKKYGSTCLSSVRIWDARPYFWLADADAIKVIISDRHTFQKDVAAYKPLNIYGENLVGTEGTDWKRHRAVAKPAFSEANNALVWRETIRIMNEWFHELDVKEEQLRSVGTQTSELVIDVTAAMVQATLLIISAAGFGRRTTWISDSSTDPPPGHTLTFRSAVGISVNNVILKVLVPSWLYGLPMPFLSSRLQNVNTAFEELRMYMLELVSQARATIAEGKQSGSDAALLKNLVEANMVQEGDYKSLNDEELLSNIFTFLLAGHETSAHSLSFTIALLALYPEVQQRVYEEVVRVWPTGIPSTESSSSYKEHFPKLEYTTAVFRETLRHFPAEPRLAKPVHAHAILPARRFTPYSSNCDDQYEFTVPVPAGSCVIIDIYATHMNPIHWGQDVAEFKPERFIDTEGYRWPRDAFLAFSAGARGCIGQRFSLAESICIIASLVHRYEILIPPGLRSKSLDEQKTEMLKWTTGVTLTPTNSRVQLQRRT